MKVVTSSSNTLINAIRTAYRSRSFTICSKGWHPLHDTLGDPRVALRMMHERAWENLRRYKAKQPLLSHLLPYLTAAEAREQGLKFREEHGWIEEP